MPPADGDDSYITWDPHPDAEVEEIFGQANRDGFVIFRLGHVYTVVSPDATKAMEFPDHLPASSGIRRHMVNDLRNWLAHTKDSDPEGRA
jgi:hypothetical protein